MKNYYSILFLILLLLVGCANPELSQKPKIALSFDDPHTKDVMEYKSEVWNDMIISKLDSADLQAILFVQSKLVNTPKGKALLSKWDKKGHCIGNHTVNHLNYNDTNMTCRKYSKEIQACDSFISEYNNAVRIIRFPFLRAGNTVEKRDSMRLFFAENGYINGWVTIDNSDWYIKNRLKKRLQKNSLGNCIKDYREFYIHHILERANYYNKLSREINGREIPHVLLLHFNFTSALFLSDLIERFEQEGWEWVDYSDAIKDSVYLQLPNAMPCDQSFVWSQAKESGKYEDILRYPAEDGRYEKAKMDSLGL